MKSFIEKYQPKKSEDIPQDLSLLKSIIKGKKCAMVYGQTGTCKTSSTYTIANELNLETIEVNASDFRTKEQINTIIGKASQQQSLFMKEKILIIDEVDCLSGREDRGGATAIAAVIKTTKFPIILTANDPFSDKIKEIKKIVPLIEFPPIRTKEITKILKEICDKEKVEYDLDTLSKISINSSGDLRAAINDLQSNIINNRLVSQNQQREYEIGINHILNQIFKQKTIEAYKALENTNIDLNEYSLWLDQNLPIEYQESKDLFNAYELFSKADIFKGRITRWQYWRFMYYQSLLLTSGISLAKKQINKKFSPYKRSSRPLRIWQINMKTIKRKTITEKLAKNTHCSTREITKNFDNYLNILNNKVIQEELQLNQEEIEWIKKQLF